MKYFIDSNSLWWFSVKSSTNHNQVRDYLNSLLNDDDELFVNEIIVMEYFHGLIKSIGLNKGQLLVNRILSDQSINLAFSDNGSEKQLRKTA